MPGPLHNIRVLDLTTVLMGPYACEMLAEHGADVIKVEELGGEVARQIGPARSHAMSAMYLGLNRSKRAIAVDLKKPDGMAIIRRLIPTCDVMVSNLRPPALARLGLTYEDVRALNEDIIYCVLTGYGSGGPYAGRPAFDDLIQGAAGIPAIFSQASGLEPRYAPINLADRTVGLHAAFCISTALVHRAKTGQGQKIEVPMFETMASFVLSDHLYGHVFEPPLTGPGYVRLLSKDRRPYKTKDGYICAVVYTDEQWKRLFEHIGRPDVAHDERFNGISARTRNIDVALDTLSGALVTRTTAEWLEVLCRLDIPCAPLNTLDMLLTDEHLNAVDFYRVIDHPTEGKLRVIEPTAKWSETKPAASRECARVGADTAEVLAELGYGARDIARLVREKAVSLGDTPEIEMKEASK